LKEQETNKSYEFLVNTIPFEAVSGVYQEVLIKKTQAFNYTVFNVTDSAKMPVAGAVLELYNSDSVYISEFKTDSAGHFEISLPTGSYYVVSKAASNGTGGMTKTFQVLATTAEIRVDLGVESYDAYISGIVYDAAGNPLSNVGLVAVDDRGEEYSTAISNFEGQYSLKNLPERSVIFVMVYKAPYGITGECDSNRVLVRTMKTEKDLVLKTLDELNADRSEADQILQYEFYKLRTVVDVSDNGGESSWFDGDQAPVTTVERTPVTTVVTSMVTSMVTSTPVTETDEDGSSLTSTVIGIVVVVVAVAGIGVAIFGRKKKKKPEREVPARRKVVPGKSKVVPKMTTAEGVADNAPVDETAVETAADDAPDDAPKDATDEEDVTAEVDEDVTEEDGE
jgi:hypothetical protein